MTEAATPHSEGGSIRSFASPDLKALREKLMKNVEITSVQLVGPERPKPKHIFSDRPYLSANFVTERLPKAGVRAPSSLSGVPALSQERLLVRELLYLLVGHPGEHITPQQGNRFSLSPCIELGLASLIKRLLPLAAHYSRVTAFIEDVSGLAHCGLVNQALVSSLSHLLSDYTLLVCQLEGEELSLHELWFQLQGSLHSMELLASVVSRVGAGHSTGGGTLSVLHEVLTMQQGNTKAMTIVQRLIETASQPFFQVLAKWIYRGVIDDPGKDFFVEDHEVVERSCLPTEYNDDYWEKRYCLRQDKVPTFLASYADTVLRTGKYLNVIQQCEAPGGETHSLLPLLPLSYLATPQQYEAVLTNAHTHASTTLLQLLVRDRDLIGHLSSVKKYFLMEQGDFISQFLDLAESQLNQPVDDVEPGRLESLLELVTRITTANSDPYKDNLRVALLPYDLIFQMGKILAIDTAEEAEYQVWDTTLLSGLDAFAFGYEVEWPVSLVLNHKALAQYQMLFRHFFFCKHVERQLCAVWICNKQTKYLPLSEFQVYSRAFGLRQKMLNLLQNLSYYMAVEVIEPAWHSLVTSIEGCTTVDQVLVAHSSFLNSCLQDCLLSSPHLLASVKKLLGVCTAFSDYMHTIDRQATHQFIEDMERYDLEFSSVLFSLLDKISQLGRDNYNEKILNILHRLDFNGFYSKAIDQFKSSPNEENSVS